MVAGLFCDITFKAPKPLSPLHPIHCHSLGDHIRTIRLNKKMLQREVAKELGVDTTTLEYWERNSSNPRPKYYAKIIEFLGYLPSILKESRSWGTTLLEYRTSNGISQMKLAKMIGIEVRILRRLERKEEGFISSTKEKIKAFIKRIEE